MAAALKAQEAGRSRLLRQQRLQGCQRVTVPPPLQQQCRQLGLLPKATLLLPAAGAGLRTAAAAAAVDLSGRRLGCLGGRCRYLHATLLLEGAGPSLPGLWLGLRVRHRDGVAPGSVLPALLAGQLI